MKIHISISILLVLCLSGSLCFSGNLLARDFERGDVNEDGSFDISDAIGMLNHMFLGDVAYCQDAMDVNDDGILNIADAIVSINYLFLNGDAPESPFGLCGPDLTKDNLTCESYSQCNLGDAILGLDLETFASFVRGRELMSKEFTPEEGLGPFYNATSCTACHSTPVPGGSAPIYRNFFFAAVGVPGSQGPIWDPELPSIVMPAYALPGNPRPAFPDPSQVGNQPVTIVQRNAPPQLGVGLFERISNSEIFGNSDPDDSDGDGISGRFNTDGSGNLGRFGFKAQANFLEAFLRGASNNQMGITTDPFLGSGGIVSAAMMQVSAGFRTNHR